ncbi:MAG: hypothetical protein AseanaTS_30760 [Candidatus Pelagadaptatus aseana]|uniref:hypothetical protein n=1 Tax=Candidatus Pelagadaptatus aseana TaxID=3120508 RepID=UPI0039B291BF
MADPKDSPEAILGELESIKDLLSEDELAAIPTLEDAIPLSATTSDNVNTDAGLPDSELAADEDPQDSVEESFDLSDLPLLTEAAEASEPITEVIKSPSLFSRPIDLDLALLSREQPEAEQIKPANTDEQTVDDETSDQYSAGEDIVGELEVAQAVEAETVETESSQILPDQESETDNGTENSDKSGLSASDLEPLMASDLEPLMAPDALPGQQSLFEVPVQSDDKTGSTSAPRKPELPKAPKGENPFLPKHIRERLHTDRSLMDVIKDEPISTTPGSSLPDKAQSDSNKLLNLDLGGDSIVTVSAEQLDEIIENAIQERLKGIEYSIKEELLELLEQKTKEPE